MFKGAVPANVFRELRTVAGREYAVNESNGVFCISNFVAFDKSNDFKRGVDILKEYASALSRLENAETS